MKNTITLFLMLIAFTVSAQTETETIKKANDLIENKKYESAFDLLDSIDPHNSKPDVVLLKQNIVQNYFVTSIMHRMFALKDLEKDEDIMDYRGGEGSFSMHMFEVDSILENLIKANPENCKLYKGLGEFYFEIHLRYSGRWLMEDEEVFSLMETNFKKAVEGNCADFFSHYVLGYNHLAHERYEESIPFLLKSITLKNDYPSAHYNLAYAYLYADDKQNALKYAKNSLDLYTDQVYKSDAARMVGQIYTELDDDKNALENYELADKIDPGNYYNIKQLLNLYVKTSNKKAEETGKTFFNLGPDNPMIYDDLEEIYYYNKKENDLSAFYTKQLDIFKDNKKVQATLNFYLGRIALETDKNLAKKYLLKSKEVFSKIYDKDHQVFTAIEKGLKECEK